MVVVRGGAVGGVRQPRHTSCSRALATGERRSRRARCWGSIGRVARATAPGRDDAVEPVRRRRRCRAGGLAARRVGDRGPPSVDVGHARSPSRQERPRVRRLDRGRAPCSVWYRRCKAPGGASPAAPPRSQSATGGQPGHLRWRTALVVTRLTISRVPRRPRAGSRPTWVLRRRRWTRHLALMRLPQQLSAFVLPGCWRLPRSASDSNRCAQL